MAREKAKKMSKRENFNRRKVYQLLAGTSYSKIQARISNSFFISALLRTDATTILVRQLPKLKTKAGNISLYT
jgi:hypothetical protein